MLKKLTEEQKSVILETGIAEFAEKGLNQANINVIAKKAGISVGVLYKYYKDKDAFFLACLRRSLDFLEAIIADFMNGEEKMLARVAKMIRALQYYSRLHPNYVNMYNEITSGSSKKYAPMLARQIEGVSAKVYTEFITKAKENGDIRSDINPKMFAFFFDNLLMMMHFSYCSEYYRERFKIYCGEDVFDNDALIESELLKFIESAFTFDQSAIVHKGQMDIKS